jgi:hypothetical protein
MTTTAVRFERYMSDGPGYVGAVEVVIGSGEVRLRLDGHEDQVCSLKPPDGLRITGWRQATSTDCEALWPYLNQAEKEHAEAPMFIEHERLAWLDLEGGGVGAVMLGGEPCCVRFFDLRKKAGGDDARAVWEFG